MSETITMAHGSGGTKTSELIERIFKKYLGNPLFTADDAAVLPANKIGYLYGRIYCVTARLSRRKYR